jgi:hypothetical protein
VLNNPERGASPVTATIRAEQCSTLRMRPISQTSQFLLIATTGKPSAAIHLEYEACQPAVSMKLGADILPKSQ